MKFSTPNDEILRKLGSEEAKSFFPQGTSRETYDWGGCWSRPKSKSTIRGYEGAKNFIADFLGARSLGSVDNFLGIQSTMPSLEVLRRIIKAKARTSKGLIRRNKKGKAPLSEGALRHRMTAHSLAGFVNTILGAISYYMKRPVPPIYYKSLIDYAYYSVSKDLELSYETFPKFSATPEEFDRFIRRVMVPPQVQTFKSLRDVLYYILYVNLYVDTGARGTDLTYLTFGDCQFYIAPKSQRGIIIGIVSLTHLKCRYESEKKTIPLHSMELNRFYTDSCRLLFSAAMSEGVFDHVDNWDLLQSVTRGDDVILLPMKKEKLASPVFSCIKSKTPISRLVEKGQRNPTFYGQKTLQLATSMGLSRRVTLYSFRRMALQAMVKNRNVSKAQRMRFAGHSDSAVYAKAYAPRMSEADMQSRFRGQPARTETIRMFNGIEAQQILQEAQIAVRSKDLVAEVNETTSTQGEEETLSEEGDKDLVLKGDNTESDDSENDDDTEFVNEDDDEITTEESTNQNGNVKSDFEDFYRTLTESHEVNEALVMNKCTAWMTLGQTL